MMRNGRSIFDKLAVASDLPDEAIPQLPLVEIAGDRRVLIENHMGVVAYGRQSICIKVRYGTLNVCGQELELTRMTKGQLVISGVIEQVILNRRCS